MVRELDECEVGTIVAMALEETGRYSLEIFMQP